MATINPCEDARAWKVCQSVEIANAGNYYTKRQVDKLITGELTPEEIQEMVDESVSEAMSGLTTKQEFQELAEQVSANTEAILNTYTKDEVYTKEETHALLGDYLTKLKAKEMFRTYTQVQDTTLILNAENIH